MSETKDTQYLNEPLVKQLTGGDKVAARGNYQDAHTYNVTFNPILLTNAMPNVAEGGDALWDRLSAIPFSCRWERNGKAMKQLEHPIADSWFEYGLLQDVECLRWFLWWLVQGGVLWEEEGTPDIVPTRVQKLMGTYKAKNNPFEELIFDCGLAVVEETTEDPSKCIPSAIAYSIYRQHTLDNGNTPVAQKTFTLRLLAQFPQLTLGQTRIDGVLMRDYFGKSKENDVQYAQPLRRNAHGCAKCAKINSFI
jgi:putative DNA primase/helicase